MTHDSEIQEILILAEDYIYLRVSSADSESVYKKLQASNFSLSMHAADIRLPTGAKLSNAEFDPENIAARLEEERMKMLLDVVCSQKGKTNYPANKDREKTPEQEKEIHNWVWRPYKEKNFQRLNAVICNYFMRDTLDIEMADTFPRTSPRQAKHISPKLLLDESILAHVKKHGKAIYETYLEKLSIISPDEYTQEIKNERAREDYIKYEAQNPEMFCQARQKAQKQHDEQRPMIGQFIDNHIGKIVDNINGVLDMGLDTTIFPRPVGLN